MKIEVPVEVKMNAMFLHEEIGTVDLHDGKGEARFIITANHSAVMLERWVNGESEAYMVRLSDIATALARLMNAPADVSENGGAA